MLYIDVQHEHSQGIVCQNRFKKLLLLCNLYDVYKQVKTHAAWYRKLVYIYLAMECVITNFQH